MSQLAWSSMVSAVLPEPRVSSWIRNDAVGTSKKAWLKVYTLTALSDDL